jgi:hypothetical protein
MGAENTSNDIGHNKRSNGWRMRNDDGLQGRYRKPNTVTTTRARRLKWAGRNIK